MEGFPDQSASAKSGGPSSSSLNKSDTRGLMEEGVRLDYEEGVDGERYDGARWLEYNSLWMQGDLRGLMEGGVRLEYEEGVDGERYTGTRWLRWRAY